LLSTSLDDQHVGRESAARSGATPASGPASGRGPQATSEVVPSEKRRRRTTAYKLRVLAEADTCVQRGELGALLRREGVYHSDISNWRKQMANGTLGSAPASRGSRSTPEYQETVRQLTVVSGENRQLRRQLARAHQIIEIQKKAARLLGETLQEMSLDDIDDEC